MKMGLTSAGIAMLVIAGTVSADTVNFDSYKEGFYGPDFTFGSVNFFNTNNLNGVNPDGNPFTPDDIGTDLIIENSEYAYNDFPDVISPLNTLTFGRAYVPGPNLSLGALCTVSMGTGSAATRGEFDVIYYDEPVWEGILVTLEATRFGNLVASTSFTITPHDPGGRNIVDTRHLVIDGVEFDTLRFHATLGGVPTTFRALVDNVAIVPSAPSLAGLVLGGLVMGRRRR